MAENTEINVGGVWKSIDNCEVNVGGAWKQVEAIEINVGGVWKTVWTNKSITMPADNDAWLHTSSSTDNPTYAGIRFTAASRVETYDPDGSVTDRQAYADGYTPGSDLWIRCTHNSGTAPSGDVTGSWLQINTTRGWYISDSNPGVTAVNSDFTIEIAEDSGGTTIVGTETYTPQANYDTV